MRVRLPRERLTIGSLMIVVALTGGYLAVARIHVILGIPVAITLILTVVRTSLAIDWLKARGRTAEAGRVAGILIDSLNRSACLVTAMIIGYLMFVSLFIPPSLHQPMPPFVWVIGLLPAFGISYWLRRLYWPPPLRPAASNPPPPG